jgi:hypothetical protein
MTAKGICSYCKHIKPLYYTLSSKDTQHCIRCHRLGYHRDIKVETTRVETQAEYFARFNRQIEAKRGLATYTEAELGPRIEVVEAIYSRPSTPRTPRSPRIVVNNIKTPGQLKREALEERKRELALLPPTAAHINREKLAQQRKQQRSSDKDLEALRRAKRREMDYNVKNYQPRREYGSRTPLK